MLPAKSSCRTALLPIIELKLEVVVYAAFAKEATWSAEA
jgi:hypothetical protein